MTLASVIRYIKVLDTASTTGAGLTGKAFGDFTAKYVVDGGTLTSLTPETITTLGTYQAPTSAAHIRIKELNSAAPSDGIYEVHFHDTTLATGTRLLLMLSVTGGRVEPYELDLEDVGGNAELAATRGGVLSMLSAMLDHRLTAHSRAVLSGLSAAKSVALPDGATSLDQFHCVAIQPKTQGIAFTVDGTTPTASVGRTLAVGMVEYVTDVSALQIIELAASATVEVTYFAKKGIFS